MLKNALKTLFEKGLGCRLC